MITVTRGLITNSWVAYSLTKHGEDKPCFIWYCKFRNLCAVTDAIKNPDFDANSLYTLQPLEYFREWHEAAGYVNKLLKSGPWPVLNKTQHTNRITPVQCVETGQIFNTQRDCAQQLGINQGQLCQHLRGNPSYRTVKSMTFRNVSSAQGFRYPNKGV